jgi:hypothetical protein
MKTKATYDLLNFIRPEGYYPYSLEQCFGVFAWMVRTAKEFYHYCVCGPLDLLSTKPSCTGLGQVDPIVSLPDLQKRFHYAILCGYGSASAVRWRAKYKIRPTGRVTVAFRHYKPMAGSMLQGAPRCEAQIVGAVQALLGATGSLAVQLNSCWRQAKEICGVRVHVGNGCDFRFVLDYGFDGSVWHHTLAASGKRDTFISTLDRAITEFLRVADAKAGAELVKLLPVAKTKDTP